MAKRKNGAHHRTMKVYGSYNFRSKDPVIDEVRTLIQDEYGTIGRKNLASVEERGGPSVGCMTAWFHKGVRRPTNASIEAAGRSLGKKRIWVRHNDR